MNVRSSVFNCARCNEDHEDLIFEELEHYMSTKQGIHVWTHFCLCPTNGQPIMMEVNLSNTDLVNDSSTKTIEKFCSRDARAEFLAKFDELLDIEEDGIVCEDVMEAGLECLRNCYEDD